MFYQIYVPVSYKNGLFIWYPYKIYHSKAYAVKVISSKVSCFAIVRTPYSFCDDSEKKLYIYGNYRFYNGLTLDKFALYKKVCFC